MDFIQRLYTLAQQLVELMTTLLHKLDNPTHEDHSEYVDTAWVKSTFNISASTLSDYRRRGVLPYTFFEDRGKIYYKSSDIYEVLNSNYKGNLE